jgi:predicted small secreted protein
VRSLYGAVAAALLCLLMAACNPATVQGSGRATAPMYTYRPQATATTDPTGQMPTNPPTAGATSTTPRPVVPAAPRTSPNAVVRIPVRVQATSAPLASPPPVSPKPHHGGEFCANKDIGTTSTLSGSPLECVVHDGTQPRWYPVATGAACCAAPPRTPASGWPDASSTRTATPP